jgi:hypothetical protein
MEKVGEKSLVGVFAELNGRLRQPKGFICPLIDWLAVSDMR